MSSIKSPEHQQGPTSLAPSNSGRRKEAATPEGECRSSAAAAPSDPARVQALICLHQPAAPVSMLALWSSYYPFSFAHLSERRRVTFESKWIQTRASCGLVSFLSPRVTSSTFPAGQILEAAHVSVWRERRRRQRPSPRVRAASEICSVFPDLLTLASSELRRFSATPDLHVAPDVAPEKLCGAHTRCLNRPQASSGLPNPPQKEQSLGFQNGSASIISLTKQKRHPFPPLTSICTNLCVRLCQRAPRPWRRRGHAFKMQRRGRSESRLLPGLSESSAVCSSRIWPTC